MEKKKKWLGQAYETASRQRIIARCTLHTRAFTCLQGVASMAQLFAPFRVNCFPLWDIFFVYGFPYWSIIRSLHFYYVIAAKRHPSSPTVTCVGLADFFEIGLENPMEAKKKGKKKESEKLADCSFFLFLEVSFPYSRSKNVFAP